MQGKARQKHPSELQKAHTTGEFVVVAKKWWSHDASSFQTVVWQAAHILSFSLATK